MNGKDRKVKDRKREEREKVGWKPSLILFLSGEESSLLIILFSDYFVLCSVWKKREQDHDVSYCSFLIILKLWDGSEGGREREKSSIEQWIVEKTFIFRATFWLLNSTSHFLISLFSFLLSFFLSLSFVFVSHLLTSCTLPVFSLFPFSSFCLFFHCSPLFLLLHNLPLLYSLCGNWYYTNPVLEIFPIIELVIWAWNVTIENEQKNERKKSEWNREGRCT